MVNMTKAKRQGFLELYVSHGLTINEIADKYGVTKAYVYRLIKDTDAYKAEQASRDADKKDRMETSLPDEKRKKDAMTIEKAARILNRSIEDFMEENDIDSFSVGLNRFRKTDKGRKMIQGYDAVKRKQYERENLEALGMELGD